MNTEDLRRSAGLPLHPGINFSCLEIEANLGGLVFAVGSVVCLLIGLPSARGFFAGALAGGVLSAAGLAWWHEHHRGRDADRVIRLGLKPRG